MAGKQERAGLTEGFLGHISVAWSHLKFRQFTKLIKWQTEQYFNLPLVNTFFLSSILHWSCGTHILSFYFFFGGGDEIVSNCKMKFSRTAAALSIILILIPRNEHKSSSRAERFDKFPPQGKEMSENSCIFFFSEVQLGVREVHTKEGKHN